MRIGSTEMLRCDDLGHLEAQIHVPIRSGVDGNNVRSDFEQSRGLNNDGKEK